MSLVWHAAPRRRSQGVTSEPTYREAPECAMDDYGGGGGDSTGTHGGVRVPS
jgi:hypothetical protein